MKFLLVSDSHGNDQILRDLVEQYPNMDYYLHAGDSQSSSMAIYPFDSVEGNCDFYNFDRCRRINTPRGYLFMKHFPNMSNKEKEGVSIFVYGHTHRYKVFVEDGIINICPGSLSRPRDDSNGSYAILEVNEDKIKVVIIDIETKNILECMEL